MTLGETLYKLRVMTDKFIREHAWEWDKVRAKYEEEKGFPLGQHLTLQSHIASDMLIDMTFLVLEFEKKVPFTREYWIRSHGTQCIKNDEDADACRKVFNDIIAKIKVVFDGEEFTNVSWFEDEDCKIKNRLLLEE